jgi:hypothetical protein
MIADARLPLCWYALEDFAGKHWVFTDATKIQNYLSSNKVFQQLNHIFDSKSEADKWQQATLNK